MNQNKISEFCYLPHLINNETIKYAKQNDSNHSKCLPWDSMHFPACIISDLVASSVISE